MDMSVSEVATAATTDHVAASTEECLARSLIYRLLAGAFAEEPSRAYLAALRATEGLAALADMGWQFEDDFLATDLAELEDTLACEYATLFTVEIGRAHV
jgi:TorA maturation chaperone TorD